MSDINNWHSLGNKYYNEKNYTEAFRYYMLAANQGHAGAQKFVGACYEFGLVLIKPRRGCKMVFKSCATG